MAANPGAALTAVMLCWAVSIGRSSTLLSSPSTSVRLRAPGGASVSSSCSLRQPDDFLPVDLDAAAAPGIAWEQAEDREGRDGLSRPGLPHDAERLAGPQIEADAVDRADHPVARVEVDGEIPDFEDGIARREVSRGAVDRHSMLHVEPIIASVVT